MPAMTLALEHLAHLHVVDLGAQDPRALECLARRVLREVERAHVEQRSLARGADRSPSGGDDHSVRHDFLLQVSVRRAYPFVV